MTAGFVKHYKIEKYSTKPFVSGSPYKWRKIRENVAADGHRVALQNMFETTAARLSKLKCIGRNRVSGNYSWMSDGYHDDKAHVLLRIHKDNVGADHSFAHYYRAKEVTGDDSAHKWKYYMLTLTPWAIFKELSQHYETIQYYEGKQEEVDKVLEKKATEYHLYSSKRETEYEWKYRGKIAGFDERDALSNWFLRMDVPEMRGKLIHLHSENGAEWYMNKSDADAGDGANYDGMYRVCISMDHENNWGYPATSAEERQKWS